MKDRTTMYIALIIGGLAFVQFIVLPAIRHRTSQQVVDSILRDWKAANGITPMTHWANRNSYPSLPQLVTYRVRNRQVLKVNDKLIARFTVTLNFVKNPGIPQNSEWLFVMNKVQGNWKVVDFRLSKLHPSDIKVQAARYDADADRKKLRQMEQARAANIQQQQVDQQQKEAFRTEPLRPIPTRPVPAVDESQLKRPGYRKIPAFVD